MRTISNFNKRSIEQTYSGIAGWKICVSHLGVELTERPIPKDYDEPERPLHILSVGDLIPEKGHLYLIEACRILRQRGVPFECTIIGEGSLRDELERAVGRSRLSASVRLPGGCNFNQVRELLNSSDLFVLACTDLRKAGRQVDGIPVALMEAMASGLPVVSTIVSGIPELVETDTSGLLVSDNDSEALADAIERLIRDSSLRTSIGRSAKLRIERHFNLKQNAKLLALMFQRNSCE